MAAHAVVVDEGVSHPRSTPTAGKARAQVAPIVRHEGVRQSAGELKLNESKPCRLIARFTETEREEVVRQAEKACLTISDYIRLAVLGPNAASSVDPVKTQHLQNISRELGRQGNNLNQIAKHLNAETASPDQGNSMLAIIARSLMSAHQSVRKALAQGRSPE